MGLFKRSNNDSDHVEKPAPEDDLIKDQKVTFIACWLGLVASIGGFMFGYVR